MSWAFEIYAELCREEASAALDEEVWYECGEWPRGEFVFEDYEEKEAQRGTQGWDEGLAERGGRNEATQARDIRILEQQATDWTRGELVGPIQRTGTSNEAEMVVAVAEEGFLMWGEGV